jgi:hypothetical protein
MIYRVPITKDNTISTWSEIPSLRNLGNSGKSQIVDVWGNYRADKNLRFITRFLGEANLTALQAAISNTSVPDPVTDSTVSCNLKFFNINSAEVEAYEYTLQVFPVTRSWQEGRGTRIDSFTNTAFSNWLSASNTAAWSNTGGDFDTSVTASQYFESGSENLNINTRTMLVNWLSGASANYGFIVKMAQPAEDFGSLSTGTQYYRKSFHGRLTNYPNFAPYFQLEWVSQIVDDRSILTFGNTANLYFYNAPNGIYTDIDSVTSSFPGKVTLSGSIQGVSGALSASTAIVTDNGPASGYWPVVTNITPLRVKKGVYRALFTLPTSASIFNKFTDVWNVTSAASAVTLSSGLIFYPTSTVSGETNYANLDMNISIPGWKNVYDKNSIINKKVYFIEKTGKVIPLTQSEKNSISSISSSTQTTFISTDGYWRILTDALGSVDVDWQKLEYDGHSNFFTIDLSNFARQVRYQLEFKIAVRGNTMIFDNQNGSNIHYFEVF